MVMLMAIVMMFIVVMRDDFVGNVDGSAGDIDYDSNGNNGDINGNSRWDDGNFDSGGN